MQLQTVSKQPTMSSLELVDFINEQRPHDEPELQHKNFIAKVPQVLGETSAKFLADLPDSYGRPRRGYRFPKREACLMAMSYSYELQAKVFDRMTELELRSQVTQAIPNFADPVVAARAWADAKEGEQKAVAQLAQAAPKVEYVDRYVAANGAMGFRQVAKLLNAKEPEFRAFLEDSKILYRLGGVLTPYQNHIEAGRFAIKTGVSQLTEHAYAQARFTPKGVNWVAGEWAKHLVAQKVGVPA